MIIDNLTVKRRWKVIELADFIIANPGFNKQKKVKDFAKKYSQGTRAVWEYFRIAEIENSKLGNPGPCVPIVHKNRRRRQGLKDFDVFFQISDDAFVILRA